MLGLFLILPLLFAPPNLNVNWVDQAGTALRVRVDGLDELLEKCASSGVEVRFRYQIKLCRRRSWWLDRCSDSLQMLHSVKLDPIGESYRVSLDELGDTAPAQAISAKTLSEAFELATTIKQLSFQQLREEAPFGKGHQAYVSVRTLSDCKGEYNQVAAGISTVLTLGLIKVGSFDSGWIDFDLGQATSAR